MTVGTPSPPREKLWGEARSCLARLAGPPAGGATGLSSGKPPPKTLGTDGCTPSRRLNFVGRPIVQRQPSPVAPSCKPRAPHETLPQRARQRAGWRAALQGCCVVVVSVGLARPPHQPQPRDTDPGIPQPRDRGIPHSAIKYSPQPRSFCVPTSPTLRVSAQVAVDLRVRR